ncbi:MAG: hypothetical protein AAF416_03615 [Pseudomonadota bacterium]
MLAFALATLLSVSLPEGAEPYLSEGSAYAEFQSADITITVFDAELAAQAIAEFRETFEKPETARAGVEVMAMEETTLAERPATLIDYRKPAAVARLTDEGEVEIVPGIERTRQIYLSLGGPSLVLTIWTKLDDVDIVAVADGLVASLVPGEGKTTGEIALMSGGEDLGTLGGKLADAPLAAPLVIDAVAE